MALKILLLTHNFYPYIGGIEINSEILAEAFKAAGHDVHVVTWTVDSTKRQFPFPVIRNPGVRLLFREHAWADVILENNPCLRLSWPNLFLKRPFVVMLNTVIDKTVSVRGVQGWLKLLWLKRARQVASVSEAVRQLCWPAATVIANPYRVHEFRMLPGVPHTTDFVFLGRLVSQKGASYAIRAVHQLHAQQPGPLPRLTIVGDGPERPALEALVAKLGLQQQVRFTGALCGHALVECLNRHRFMLVPSLLEEAFGNVVLEGLACGCLPIVSDSGGLPEAAGEAGISFRRGDVDSLLASIRHLLTTPALEQRLRSAAPRHLAAHHPAVVAQQYLKLIEAAAC